MPASRALPILLLILFIPLAKGCTPYTSVWGVFNSPFEGCWEGADWGGIHLYLEAHGSAEPGKRKYFSGFLLINLSGGFTEDLTAYDLTSYSVQGEVKSDGLAILQGTNSSTPTQRDEITVLLITGNNSSTVDDVVTLQINNGPPSAPLARCP